MKHDMTMLSRIWLIAAAMLAIAAPLSGQDALVPIIQPDLGQVTGIAPAFFGPNAYDVPEMSDGTTTGTLSASVAGGYFGGFIVKGSEDHTADLFAQLNIPLFTDRVNLKVWMPLSEWWKMSPQVMAARRINPSLSSGHDIGAAFLCLEVQALKEKPRCPGIVVRAALRTASEDKAFAAARSYDAPGYFFDFSVGKLFGPVRLALSSGFLCWQTDNGRQNDAIMFGILAKYSNPYANVSAQYGGYWGWERYGDFPRVVKTRIDICPKWLVHPWLTFQYGFHDWPFYGIRAGIQVDFSLIGEKGPCKYL